MITFDRISRLLKQKVPFVFIDRILEYEQDKKIVALKNISGCEMFSSLHFPDSSVYPGILLVETVAQATAVLCHLSGGDDVVEKSGFVALGGIQQFQFLKPARPGDCLIIQVDIIKKILDMVLVKAQIGVGEDIIACGQLSFGVIKSEE